MEAKHREGLNISAHQLEILCSRYWHLASDSSTSTYSVLSLEKIPEGFNNVTYRSQIRANATMTVFDCAVRLSKLSSWPRSKILGEANAIRYLRDAWAFPVPEVYFSWVCGQECTEFEDATPGVGGFVMSWVNGRILDNALFVAASEEFRKNCVEDVVGICRALSSMRFAQVGSLLSEDKMALASPLPVMPCGDTLDGLPGGPYPSACEFYCDTVRKHFGMLQKLELLFPSEASVVRGHLERLSAVTRELQTVTTAMNYVMPVAASHGDLAGRNIIVAPETGRIVSLLDWEWFAAMPVPYDLILMFDDLGEDARNMIVSELFVRGVYPDIIRDTSCELHSLSSLSVTSWAHTCAFHMLSAVGDVIPWYVTAMLRNDMPLDEPLLLRSLAEVKPQIDKRLVLLEQLLKNVPNPPKSQQGS